MNPQFTIHKIGIMIVSTYLTKDRGKKLRPVPDSNIKLLLIENKDFFPNDKFNTGSRSKFGIYNKV